MNPSHYGYFGIVVAILVVAIAVILNRKAMAKSKLPELPAFGPLPLADLPRYFALKEPALAWEAVRGWNLNQRPSTFSASAPVDQIILTGRVLDFCSGNGGHIQLIFNFLVAAIEDVDFNPGALSSGLAPEGYGLATIYTPSGETLMITSPTFVQTLKNAIARE
jgi:hypothetical protein